MRLSQSAIQSLLAKANYPVYGQNLEKITTYLKLVLKWNRCINLISSQSLEDIINKLVLDSFILASILSKYPFTDQSQCFDLGSGAGFPAIILRILWDSGTCTLIEKRQKRAIFLRTVCATLGLKNTHIFEGSVEEYFANKNNVADLLVSKAFLPIPKLLPLAKKLLAPNGYLAVLANTSATKERTASWDIVEQVSYTILTQKRWVWFLSMQKI